MNFIPIFISLQLFFACVPEVLSTACRSYGKQAGMCVDIAECPPLLTEVMKPNKTTSDIRRLQGLTCYALSLNPKNQPFVCCPLTEIVRSSFLHHETEDSHEVRASQPTRRPTTVSPTTPVAIRRTRITMVATFPTQRPVSTFTTTETLTPSSTQNEGGTLHTQKFLNLIPPLANCSEAGVTNKIVGGKEAEVAQYPWMARLAYKNLRTGHVEYYCGGVVISKRYILTAAHCTFGYDENFELVHVRLGEHDTKRFTDCSFELQQCSTPVDVPVESVLTHKDYNTASKHNDIALIRVARDISFQSYFVKPVCLPFFKEYGILDPKPVNSKVAVVTGWGRTNWTRNEGSEKLQYVHLPLVPSGDCMRLFKNRVKITPKQLCAGGERQQDSCSGDSGGPLMMDQYVGHKGAFQSTKTFQIGIVSFGPVKCGIGIPGVYTKVSEYLGWILDNMES